ncbi:MAG: calcium/sodium antiporter [Lautropia sp.]
MESILPFALGLALLIGGAEVLVRGASRLALAFGISPLVVGLTVVSFGTSSPELAVSVQAAWNGQADVAIGNIVGSNVLNVLLILGLSALIVPLLVHRQLVRQEVPLMIGASLLLFVFALDASIGRVEGLVLFALLIVYTVFVVRQSRAGGRAAEVAEPVAHADGADGVEDTRSEPRRWPVQVAMIVVGLAMLVQGSNLLVDAALVFARLLGVSETVIGLTIVALGTSLPEIATSVLAAIRGERDIAVGNVLGSNLFNILCVAGIASMVAPTGLTVAPSVLAFDLPVMIAVAALCLPIFFSGGVISRGEGAVFALGYVAYTTWLILAAAEHAALEGFSMTMLLFVLPLVVVRIVFVALREWRARHPPVPPAGR